MGMAFRSSKSVTAGGKRFQQTKTVTTEAHTVREISLPAAKTGNLTTRTSDTVGTLTMDAGHGIATADLIDLYWEGGSRRSVIVGTVSTNSVPISGGSGDVLPADESEITAMVQNVETVVVLAADVRALAVEVGAKATIIFKEADNTEIYDRTFKDGAGADLWHEEGPDANPIGEDIGKVTLTHGDSTGAKTLRFVIGHD